MGGLLFHIEYFASPVMPVIQSEIPIIQDIFTFSREYGM